MTEHTILISGGRAQFVYHDDLVELTQQGPTTVIRRASHVEPAPYLCPTCGGLGMKERDVAGAMDFCPTCSSDGKAFAQSIGVVGRWVADMTPTWCPRTQTRGPVLVGPDGKGFKTREEALAAERDWLREEFGL